MVKLSNTAIPPLQKKNLPPEQNDKLSLRPLDPRMYCDFDFLSWDKLIKHNTLIKTYHLMNIFLLKYNILLSMFISLVVFQFFPLTLSTPALRYRTWHIQFSIFIANWHAQSWSVCIKQRFIHIWTINFKISSSIKSKFSCS